MCISVTDVATFPTLATFDTPYVEENITAIEASIENFVSKYSVESPYLFTINSKRRYDKRDHYPLNAITNTGLS